MPHLAMQAMSHMRFCITIRAGGQDTCYASDWHANLKECHFNQIIKGPC